MVKRLVRKLWAVIKILLDRSFYARCRYSKQVERLPLEQGLVLLESHHGRELSGNPFYIAQHLATDPQYHHLRLVVTAGNAEKHKRFRVMLDSHGMQRVAIVEMGTAAYFKTLATAQYLVNNNTFLASFIKKEGQIYLNTWHGTPLKTLGKRIRNDPHGIGNSQRNFMAADYLLFPNQFTMDRMVEDYMLENISKAECILCGYPRNVIFFNEARRAELRSRLGFENDVIYAYMPTYRGTHGNAGGLEATASLLRQWDALLLSDERLFVNLHPVIQDTLDFTGFSHIRPFPVEFETYEFLNLADALVTDYSSVFFDFAASRRKVVLFAYDKEEYLLERGLYVSYDALPFPQAGNASQVLEELRRPIAYDAGPFLEKYCPCDGPNSTKLLCERVFLGKVNALQVQPVPDNGRKNIFLYAGALSQNGITVSLRNLMDLVDHTQYNYYMCFYSHYVAPHYQVLHSFAPNIRYIAHTGEMNLTVMGLVLKVLFGLKLVPAAFYIKYMKQPLRQEWQRLFAGARCDAALQFCGYEHHAILLWGMFEGKNTIFVHNDMVREIEQKKALSRGVFAWAYSHYHTVAAVSQDLYLPTQKIAGRSRQMMVAPNTIDNKAILEKAGKPMEFDVETRANMTLPELNAFFEKNGRTFITIGRFSPEKGHRRLVDAFAQLRREEPSVKLVIVGGYAAPGSYEELEKQVVGLELQEQVALIQSVSNPFPILRRADYFVLSSFHEGVALVISEADILGKPIISTDIPGAGSFLRQHGGTVVENSTAGLVKGMRRMLAGEISPMGIDFEAYNRMALDAFYALI